MQQGSSIAVTGQAGGKNGSNSNWLREIGAGAKFWHSNPVCCGAPKPLACRWRSAPEIPVEDVLEAS
ncbi:MAG TPA: hypothetical protein VGP28_12625 [Methylocella sp.]|nr:hypothetical protein [Methylocella sp.]